jgi:glycolate oxidase FAD binding subunit
MADDLSPCTADELAAVLRAASERGQPVVPWGAGTLQHLGHAPPPGAVVLHTTGLNRVVEYSPADLTVTIEAGVALGLLQEVLGRHGQWLPWDPPVPGAATIGGLLAAGASGPLRLGYGTPRDWVLGMRVALGDGRLVRSGGKVVKNVAGYDTHKLHIGALGTLGVIAEVTFKLAPLPERLSTLVLGCTSWVTAFALAERLRARPLLPVSLVLASAPALRAAPLPAGNVLVAVRFAGVPAAVERQIRTAVAVASDASVLVVDLGDEQHQNIWQALATLVAPTASQEDAGRSLLLRAGARPAALPVLIHALERYAPTGAPTQIVGYGGVGLAYARWPLSDAADPAALAHAVAALRAEIAHEEGYAVIEDAPAALRPQLDPWGPPPPTLPLMRAIKAQWDPRGILNPGRYVGGL